MNENLFSWDISYFLIIIKKKRKTFKRKYNISLTFNYKDMFLIIISFMASNETKAGIIPFFRENTMMQKVTNLDVQVSR